MKITQWVKASPRNQGIALIIVVGSLALMTVLMLAMFSSAESEYKSTQSYVASQSAKQFADIGVAWVQAQIQNGQNSQTGATRTTHTTQPGMVQVFNPSGTFLRALKLYSSSKMVVDAANGGQQALLVDNAPSDWDDPANKNNRARWVDLNEPVVRAPISGSKAKVAVYFPIIDPRAAYNFASANQNPAAGTPSSKVEGFSYSKTPSTNTSIKYGASDDIGVVLPSNSIPPERLRLPMPVEWIYMLKDGTLGTLDDTRKFVPAIAGSMPTEDNPIIGRVAFWTDDESCKININTASEPTYSSTPYFFHERDRRWAHYPPATGEYQRYPGHPATVALSAVLIPGYRLDPYAPDPGLTMEQIRDLKDKIYDLAPKIAGGDYANGKIAGSESGTVPFVIDDVKGYDTGSLVSLHVDMNSARNERLYASVDEMLFRDGAFIAGTGRVASQITGPTGLPIFDHDTLERTRFFLTAHSRAPEFSIHGLPRVCMWPVADETKGAARRTNYDQMIALCATLRKSSSTASAANSYFFRRLEAHHATADVTGQAAGYSSVTLQRNSQLLSFIERQLTGLTYPKTGQALGGANSFNDKYGVDNVRQLAVEIFDYIRCTNLYDGVEARGNNGTGAPGAAGGSYKPVYDYGDKLYPNKFTYTAQRATPSAIGNDDKTGTRAASADTGVLPNHGTVTPAVWSSGGKSYMGIGRFFTISEIGIRVICTADGKNDDFSFGRGPKAGYKSGFGAKSGGLGSPRADQALNIKRGNGGYVAQAMADVYGYANEPAEVEGRWWSNFPPLLGDPTPSSPYVAKYDIDISQPADPIKNPKHPSYHVGFYPENWNLTLEANTPLAEDEKRVQANIDLELFCPMLGWTKFWPEWTIELDRSYVAQIKVQNSLGRMVPLFDTTSGVTLKSNDNTYEHTNVHSLGGHAGPAAVAGGRNSRAISGEAINGAVLMPSDGNYDTTGAGRRAGLQNYNLASNFITVKRDKPMKITFPSAPLKIALYDAHIGDTVNPKPVQRLVIRFPAEMNIPPPRLAGSPTIADPSDKSKGYRFNFRELETSNNRLTYYRSVQGPHWWAINLDGALGRLTGRPNPLWKSGGGGQPFWLPGEEPKPNTARKQVTNGRLDTSGGVVGFAPSPGSIAAGGPGLTPDDYSDVVRTLVPAIGDYRVLAAMNEVPEAMFVKHPIWVEQEKINSNPMTQLRTIHSYTNHYGNTEAGYLLAVDPSQGSPKVNPLTEVPEPGLQPNPKLALISGGYRNSTGSSVVGRLPDIPSQNGWIQTASAFGDFDTGLTTAREGPYVNKPDEGNFYAGNVARTPPGSSVSITKFYRAAYFTDTWVQMDDWRNGIYMTPNRMISSPVMLGSLPTGVWNTGGSQSTLTFAMNQATFNDPTIIPSSFPCRPWQTLLFRPHSAYTALNADFSTKPIHPGEINPRDHYILDLFFMPVVEPYAISEPLSVAGRVNINYQILPFTHIRRATGMHALLKGEILTAIPKTDGVNPGIALAKGTKGFTAKLWDTFWNETAPVAGDSSDGKYWHRAINVEETLKQFDERFAGKSALGGLQNGVLRAASQICEIHLVPSKGQNETSVPSYVSSLNNMTAANRDTLMATFWSNNPVTGDNIREKPYSNIYGRITTRSNTFRVHVRAQVIKKARSTDPQVFDPDKDSVLSEYRGSTVIERYIDPNDVQNPLPDYAASGSPLTEKPLDTFYQFRVVESKRFSP